MNLNQDFVSELPSFIKIDETLVDFNKYNISIKMSDYDCYVSNMNAPCFLRNEMIGIIFKEIISNLESGEISFLDISYINDPDDINRDIIAKIHQGEYDNIITNLSVAQEIQSCVMFSPSKINKHTHIYEVGKLFNKSIFINPHLSYNHEQISFLNDVGFNFRNLESFKDDNDVYHFRLEFSLKIYEKDTCYIIRDEKSEGYLLRKTEIRDTKIDEIIR